jgi:hypothetical protein
MKIVIRILIALAGVAILVSLFYAEEDWRGKRDWENCKHELEAKGEVLDWNAYIPAPVPDDSNFFKAPKMQNWFVRDVHATTNEFAGRLRNADTIASITNETAAINYLAWSDQFKADFDLIRDALKRPYARMDGDYSVPFEIPTPNFVNVRLIAQTLAQRAKCCLLLGQPEKALDELTLLNDSRHMLEAAPTGKPMTLVSAMINVAVTGLYIEAIANGLQSHIWQEPQLITIQKQLEEINLSQFVVESYHTERAAECDTIETGVLGKMRDVRHPNLMRGWLYQNLVVITKLDQDAVDCIDLTNNFILPQKADDAQRKIEAVGKHIRPYTFLAAIAVPNTAKALQTLAYDQTLANEAQIVCALERYHLARGEYPGALDALAPQYIEKLPHDIINGQPLHYRRTSDGQFVLYSVGWNETDDGGLPGTLADVKNGDWVWKN